MTTDFHKLAGSGIAALLALAPCVLAMAPARASAETIAISYSGTTGTQYSSGTGSLTFSSAGPGASLADVTAFSFTFTTDSAATFAATLADLTSFSLSSVTDPNATISFRTDAITTSTPGWAPEAFSLSGTLSNATGTVYAPVPNYFLVDTGTAALTVTGIPEPATLALFATGLGLLVLLRRPRPDRHPTW